MLTFSPFSPPALLSSLPAPEKAARSQGEDSARPLPQAPVLEPFMALHRPKCRGLLCPQGSVSTNLPHSSLERGVALLKTTSRPPAWEDLNSYNNMFSPRSTSGQEATHLYQPHTPLLRSSPDLLLGRAVTLSRLRVVRVSKND